MYNYSRDTFFLKNTPPGGLVLST